MNVLTRAGTQSGQDVAACRNKQPSRASASRVGVWTIGLPYIGRGGRFLLIDHDHDGIHRHSPLKVVGRIGQKVYTSNVRVNISCVFS